MAGVGADALVSPLHDLLGAFGSDMPPGSDPGSGLRADSLSTTTAMKPAIDVPMT